MIHIPEQLHHSVKGSLFVLIAMLALTFVTSDSLLAAEDDIVTDIILINGQAELADFTKDGEVIARHSAIPDYFTSGRSHQRSLKQSLQLLKALGSVEIEETPKFYHAPVVCRQSLMAIASEQLNSNPVVAESVVNSSTVPVMLMEQGSSSNVMGVDNRVSTTRIHPIAVIDKFILIEPKQHIEVRRRSHEVSADPLLI